MTEKIRPFPNFTKYYTDKKVCLLGSGASIKNYSINYEEYDIIVGCNRLYQTPLLDKINIFYHNMSGYDIKNYKTMMMLLQASENFEYLCFTPWDKIRNSVIRDIIQFGKKIEFENFCFTNLARIFYNRHKPKSRPLTGLNALDHVLHFEPRHVDVYGFDFYSEGYYHDLKDFKTSSRIHNIVELKKTFEKILRKNENIMTWYRSC